ncbi:hypothetical protein PSTT_16876, partial [Puccinia striiformis]
TAQTTGQPKLTAQGLRQHLSHHQISSKSADHFPELLELFAECAEELPVARSHQDNPGIRRSARIRAIMDTPKEATGPSSRFNETHSTYPERSKGKGGVFDPKTSLQTPAPKPQHRDSKAPKKRTSNDKSDVTSKRYHRGNKASSKQIGPDDQTTTPSKPHHRENNTPADTAASGEYVDSQVDRGNLLATLTKRKADSLGALADFENPSIVPNVEEHVRITTPDNKVSHMVHQPLSPALQAPKYPSLGKSTAVIATHFTGGAEVLEQVGLTEQTPDCSRLSSNSATPAVEEQHSNPTPVALCGIAVPRFDSTIPPLHVKHEHDLCLSVTPSPCRHQPPVLQEVIPSLVSPDHDEECWCMHSPQAPESPECTPRILFELPSPSAPEPKQQTSDLLEGTGQNHSLEMHTAPVDSPFFCISPRTLSNTPFPGTPLSMGRTVGKHPIGHLEDNQGNHLKITMPTIQLSHGSNSTNTDRSNLPLDQFLLSPLLVHDQVNPRQPILEFDGSNYLIWQVAIDRTLSYVTHQEGPFVSKISSFSTLPMSESRSIEVLIRNTIDPKLLVILDSRKLQTPGEMCELLNRMYQPTNRRHKLNAIKSLNKLIKCNRTISERWVVDWHQTYFEISQLKLSNDEFMGLFFQASLNLPNEVDPTVLDSLTNRRLENHPNPTFDQVSTEMFHILLDLRFKLDKTLEEPFEAEKPKVVDHKKKDNEDGQQKREGKGRSPLNVAVFLHD